MADTFFWWTGYAVVSLFALGGFAGITLWLWATFIHGRFSTILFRKTERRISIASWYNARLMSDADFKADDWPINERPFYLSYQIGERRYFMMFGILGPRRDAPIRGEHPAEALRHD